MGTKLWKAAGAENGDKRQEFPFTNGLRWFFQWLSVRKTNVEQRLDPPTDNDKITAVSIVSW
jgi:hypothetical protein